MLLTPMFFMVLYIFILGIINFIVRFKAMRNNQLSLGHFKIYDTVNYQVPEYIVRMGRHFDNQFQLPSLFLITCVVAQTTPLNSACSLVPLAWSFIVTRVIHSYIHLGTNNVRFRALSYFAGWLIVISMWVCIALNV